ncbi:hypothetical protein ACK3TF_003210 [Chlorella vulgaris]
MAATVKALAAGGATNPTLLAPRGAQQQQPRSVAGGMPASVLSDGGCSRAGGSWRRSQARRSLLVTRAVGDDDAPSVMGDWRAFRAKLVADVGVGKGWAARQAQQNLQLLEMQASCSSVQQRAHAMLLACAITRGWRMPANPVLAREETWAHATGAPEVGGLLLATPEVSRLLGEQYWQAVVLLVRHDEEGSLGLILNRPTELNMGRGRGGLPIRLQASGLDELRDSFSESRLYCGGFKAQQVITLLHGQRRLEGSVEVVPGIYSGGQDAAAAEVATGGMSQHDFRFFAGCCTWQHGALSQEIAAGAWQPAACSRTLVLKQCLRLPVPLWREAMCLLGGEWAETARQQRRQDEGSDSESD